MAHVFVLFRSEGTSGNATTHMDEEEHFPYVDLEIDGEVDI